MLIRRGEERYYRTGYVFWLLPMLFRVGRKDIIGMAVFWLLSMLIRRGEERYYRTGYVFWLLPMLIRVGRKDIIGMAMCSSFCPC
jgi:hypothetical protein